jgi:hypothetical protein
VDDPDLEMARTGSSSLSQNKDLKSYVIISPEESGIAGICFEGHGKGYRSVPL